MTGRARIPAYAGDGEFFFVSYANRNRDLVQGYLAAFHGHGYRFWYDYELTGGKSWAAELEERIRSCRFLLVFLTDASVESEWVRKEVNLALELRKPVLAAYLEPVELRHGLALQLRATQGVNAHDFDRAAAGEKLQAAIDGMLADAPGEGTLRAPTRYRVAGRRGGMAAVVVACALVAAGWWVLRDEDGPPPATLTEAGRTAPARPEDFTERIAGLAGDFEAGSIAVRTLLSGRARLQEEFGTRFADVRERWDDAQRRPAGSAARHEACVAARDALARLQADAAERERALARAAREAAQSATDAARADFVRAQPDLAAERLLERHRAAEYAELKRAHAAAGEELAALKRAPEFDPEAHARLRAAWSGARVKLARLLAKARAAECDRLIGEAGRAVSGFRVEEARSRLRAARALLPEGEPGAELRARVAELDDTLDRTGSVDEFVERIAADLRQRRGSRCRDLRLDFELSTGLDEQIYDKLRAARSREHWRLRTRRGEVVLAIRVEPKEAYGATWRVASYTLREGAAKLAAAEAILEPSAGVRSALAAIPTRDIEDEPGEHEAYSAHLVDASGWPRGWWPPSEAVARRLRWKGDRLVYAHNGSESEMRVIEVDGRPCLVDRSLVTVERYYVLHGKTGHLPSVAEQWNTEGGNRWSAEGRKQPLRWVAFEDATTFARGLGLALPTVAERKRIAGDAGWSEWCAGRRLVKPDGTVLEDKVGTGKRDAGFRCVLRLVR